MNKTRRQLLAAIGTSSIAPLAGCAGGEDADADTDDGPMGQGDENNDGNDNNKNENTGDTRDTQNNDEGEDDDEANDKDNTEALIRDNSKMHAEVIKQWIEINKLRTNLRAKDTEFGTNGDPSQVLSRIRVQEGIVHAHLIENDPAGELPVLASTDSDLQGEGTTLTGLEDSDRAWLINDWVSVRESASEEAVVTDTYAVGAQRVVGYIRQTAVDSDRYLWVEASVFYVQETLSGSNPDEDVGFAQVVDTGSYAPGDSQQNVVVIDARGEAGKLLEVYAEDDDTLRPIRLASDLRSEAASAGVIKQMGSDPEVIDEPYTAGYAPIDDTDWVVLLHYPVARSNSIRRIDQLSLNLA